MPTVEKMPCKRLGGCTTCCRACSCVECAPAMLQMAEILHLWPDDSGHKARPGLAHETHSS